MSEKCEHMVFQSTVTVSRLNQVEDGPIDAFRADIQVACGECGLRFEFHGLPGGYHPDYPTVSLDCLELWTPIAPCSNPEEKIAPAPECAIVRKMEGRPAPDGQ